jgi:hypothetical protein
MKTRNRRNRKNQEKSGATGSGERKHERDNRCPHSDPLNSNSHRGRKDRPSSWAMRVYLLNDSKAEYKTATRYISRNSTGRQLITNHNKNLTEKSEKHACFHGFGHIKKKHVYEHIRFRIIACWWRRGESIWQRK